MSYIGMATSAVGGTMESIAASMEQSAMFRAYQAELQKQHLHQMQAFNLWNGQMPNMGEEAAQSEMAQGAQDRTKMYDSLDHSTTSNSVVGPSTGDELYAKESGKNRAKLGAYSDWQHVQGIQMAKLGRGLHQVSNFAQGDAGVFPYEMYKAQHSMDELAFWGKLISSVGSGSGGSWMGTSSPAMGGSPSYGSWEPNPDQNWNGSGMQSQSDPYGMGSLAGTDF